jgi:hypothetical protein
MFDIDSKIETVTRDDEGIIFRYHDGSELKFTERFVQFTNKYGDVQIVDANSYQYMLTERPTYDELYEHWLKTK